eukprot:jgi/Picre1/33306/NNA_008630.t1
MGVAVYSFDEFLNLGKEKPADARPPKPEDLCTIMYTSGTTGDPKGVELTHISVMSTVKSMVTFLAEYSRGFDLHDEVYLSYLPLAHIFDRASEEMILYNGGSIGYWRGDIKGLVDDISALKPTLFCGVPRVFDRIYSGALEKITSSFVKKFYTIGVITGNSMHWMQGIHLTRLLHSLMQSCLKRLKQSLVAGSDSLYQVVHLFHAMWKTF